ncbi:MAG: three-Cys-motif partner protein TcmP [Chloroflexi bacterium]|nr:three-Cys-motif partner protein TcmP [Chloroflexota bacterium]
MADFYSEQEEQSRVKAEIVSKYFVAWAQIMAAQSEKIAYVDLFAGPGRYGDGQKSTPLLVLEEAISRPLLRSRLVTTFNDVNAGYARALQSEIDALPGIRTLRYAPEVRNGEVTAELASRLEAMKTGPILSFLDPWGYKGLSIRLVWGIVKDWGCDSIFFFNYNRINMGLTNELVESHMEALFGSARLAVLRSQVESLESVQREAYVSSALKDAFAAVGVPYFLPFKFWREDNRLSHYLCFVSKHFLAYSIMKDIMAKVGLVDADGVPLLEFLPKTAGRQLRFDAPRPLLELPAQLAQAYHGRTLTMKAIFEQHSVDQPFLRKHYVAVITEMEERGEVTCDERKRGLADHIRVTFEPANR